MINTSFNVRGEPIVCRPEDAYRCFMATNMDVLVLEKFVLLKEEQPDAENIAWTTTSHSSHSISVTMTLVRINHHPSRRELAWFGLIWLVVFAAVAWSVYRRADRPWRSSWRPLGRVARARCRLDLAPVHADRLPGPVLRGRRSAWSCCTRVMAVVYFLVGVAPGVALALLRTRSARTRALIRRRRATGPPGRRRRKVEQYFREF